MQAALFRANRVVVAPFALADIRYAATMCMIMTAINLLLCQLGVTHSTTTNNNTTTTRERCCMLYAPLLLFIHGLCKNKRQTIIITCSL